MKNLILATLMLAGLASVCAAETIVLVADPWPPYNNPAEDPQKGYIVEIAEAIFAKQGHSVTYRVMPWKRAIEETRKGTFDGLIGADAVEGAGFVFPEEEAGKYEVCFFVRKGNPWLFSHTHSLEKVRLGVAEGYTYNSWIDNYVLANKKDLNRVQTASGNHPLSVNIRKLVDGKIDATIAAAVTMYYTAKQEGLLDKIQYAGSGGQGRSVFLVFSPRKESSRRYAQMFDEGLRELRTSGELAEILKRYGLSDWK